ncbi:MAG TPA: methyl-accepting chemotaxis protein [Longimicrobium sp.]|nr:methyl-accepting chemotaxis protein [Longimicrobium sp.]
MKFPAWPPRLRSWRGGVRRLPLAPPLRWQLIAMSQAVVVVTLLLMLVPAWVSTHTQVREAYRERLQALARGAGLDIPAATVHALAQAGPRMSLPYAQAQRRLRSFWPFAATGAEHDGLALVQRDAGGGYRVLAHSAWPDGPPVHAAAWQPPAALVDSLRAFRAGETPVFWLADRERMAAVVPVLDGDNLVAGLVVASVDAGEAVRVARARLVASAWLPALALGVAFLLSLLLARQLARRIGRAVARAEAVARGELATGRHGSGGTDEIDRLDHAMLAMSVRLAGVIGEVRDGAVSVSAASAQLSATSQALAQGTVQQGESVGAAGAALEQMIASVTGTAEHSRVMEEAALAGADHAEAAVAAVHETVAAMHAITTRISVVQEIARKTDLLSLNAAIEAARAGEHGRGFRVVAEEVGKLSERTDTAAREIAELAVRSLQVAGRTEQLIGELLPTIRAAVVRVQQVARAAAEQAASVDEIGRAMERVDGVAEHNAAAAQELAATAEQLSAQAEALRGALDFFRVQPEPAPHRTDSAPPAQPRDDSDTGWTADAESGMEHTPVGV